MIKKMSLSLLFIVGVCGNSNVYSEEIKHEIEVFRSPSCGCCGKWVAHLNKNGFLVKDRVVNNISELKNKYHINKELESCHTAMVNGYVIEGHVHAKDIKEFLKQKPAVTGIAVPGMPVGTPGMEMGNVKENYNVISFDKSGQYGVFKKN